MGCIGFSEKVISRFESYLSGRAFKVKIDKKFSDPWNLTCGAPHESMLGPFLFLLYVNDMPQAVKFDLFLYADDTCSHIPTWKGETNWRSIEFEFL